MTDVVIMYMYGPLPCQTMDVRVKGWMHVVASQQWVDACCSKSIMGRRISCLEICMSKQRFSGQQFGKSISPDFHTSIFCRENNWGECATEQSDHCMIYDENAMIRACGWLIAHLHLGAMRLQLARVATRFVLCVLRNMNVPICPRSIVSCHT